eukprot:Rhum_TRINITY_DN22970_c0_g1::Rhum_TRINITY_DN22970_c0_g1_i1::g.176653::m.176653
MWGRDRQGCLLSRFLLVALRVRILTACNGLLAQPVLLGRLPLVLGDLLRVRLPLNASGHLVRVADGQDRDVEVQLRGRVQLDGSVRPPCALCLRDDHQTLHTHAHSDDALFDAGHCLVLLRHELDVACEDACVRLRAASLEARLDVLLVAAGCGDLHNVVARVVLRNHDVVDHERVHVVVLVPVALRLLFAHPRERLAHRGGRVLHVLAANLVEGLAQRRQPCLVRHKRKLRRSLAKVLRRVRAQLFALPERLVHGAEDGVVALHGGHTLEQHATHELLLLRGRRRQPQRKGEPVRVRAAVGDQLVHVAGRRNVPVHRAPHAAHERREVVADAVVDDEADGALVRLDHVVALEHQQRRQVLQHPVVVGEDVGLSVDVDLADADVGQLGKVPRRIVEHLRVVVAVWAVVLAHPHHHHVLLLQVLRVEGVVVKVCDVGRHVELLVRRQVSLRLVDEADHRPPCLCVPHEQRTQRSCPRCGSAHCHSDPARRRRLLLKKNKEVSAV